MNKTFSDKYFKWILGGICLIGAVMYGMLCQGDLVWMDEAYTFGMLRRSYGDICAVTALDVHPPLFYILLKAFSTPFSNKLLAGKIFAVIPYVILLAFGGVKLKKYFGAKAGLMFAWLFLMFPFLQNYSNEVRMYTLSGLFVFMNAVYAYGAYTENKKHQWLLFALSGLGAAYCHYFALAAAGVIYAILFFAVIIKKRKLILPYAVAAAATIILYLPWLSVFIEQLKYKVDNEYWIDPITLKTLKTYFLEIFGVDKNMTVALSLAGVYGALVCGVFKKGDKDRNVVLLALSVPFIVICVGVGASLLIRPVFVIRYLLPSMPLLVGAAAIGGSKYEDKWLVPVLVTVATLFGCANYMVAYVDKNTHFEGRMDEAFHNRNRDCDAYVVDIDRDDITPGQTETVLAYYETEKPIFQVIENYGYYPFENFRYTGDFDSDEYDRVIMLVAEGKEIPPQYKAVYDCEFRETTTSLWIPADVYILTKK